MARDLYQEVTDSVVAAIEAGAAGSWEMPWHAAAAGGLPMNHTTRATYRGVNILMLGMQAARHGYPVGAWASYQQWQGVGGQVRRGETGSMVVYAGQIVKEGEADSNGDATVARIGFLKRSTVFNIAQVDGVELPAVARASEVERVAAAEHLVSESGAVVKFGFDRAYYAPGPDYIGMPDAAAFCATSKQTATEGYYSTLLHELTHWTKHESRLNRDLGKVRRFGDEAYAAEELVAEMGAAFLCTRFGIFPEFRADHAAYVAGWLKALKGDKRAIFTAAARASDAVEYLVSKASDAVALAAAA